MRTTDTTLKYMSYFDVLEELFVKLHAAPQATVNNELDVSE